MYNIGKIINTHGIKGEVKVVRITDFMERFQPGTTVYVRWGEHESPHPLIIDGHRSHKGFELLHFEGLESINDVEALKERYLQIDETQLMDLEPDEYYYHEIIGCEVFTTDSVKLGVIREIMEPGPNDVWVMEQTDGKETLIPYITDVVRDVRPDEKKIIITPMEGLFD